jgi:hypothetical protein
MATAMAPLFRLDARALLKTWVALSALSQSTIRTSKCCPARRFRVTVGSLEC